MSAVEESEVVLEPAVAPEPAWWILLIAGLAWVVIALIVLRFGQASITTVGVLVGFILIGQGVNDLLAASMTPSWRWLNIALAVLFIGAGLMALFYPGKTFLVLAEIVGFLLVVVGALRVVESLVLREVSDLWWMQMVGGILLMLLGFWAGGQFFATRAYLILVWVGLSALIRGFLEIVLAFQVRAGKREPTAAR
jgi:uncharacterized membrane protein HdeD (DUF308 family)